MKRLVYLYVSNGAANQDQIPDWSSREKSQDPFAGHFITEGFCHLFRLLIADNIFDKILVVIESNRSPGCFEIGDHIDGLVVPHINELERFMRTDDILWARGGWKSWWSFLNKWHEDDKWLLFYRAASNRGAWEFWDIVLDDLISSPAQDELGRFYYPINKPINPTLFYPSPCSRVYDLMIGASHIHDRKGQHKIIPILLEYRKQFKTDLRCVMPGGFGHGAETSLIPACVSLDNLNIATPGMVSRDELHKLYNQSQLFVHLGAGGQNDRGPLEAMSCGTPVMLANEQYHAPCIRWDHTPRSFHIDADNPVHGAQQIHYALSLIDSTFHRDTHKYYQNANGIAQVVYPQFAHLFDRINSTPHKDRQKWFNEILAKQKDRPAQSAFEGF